MLALTLALTDFPTAEKTDLRSSAVLSMNTSFSQSSSASSPSRLSLNVSTVAAEGSLKGSWGYKLGVKGRSCKLLPACQAQRKVSTVCGVRSPHTPELPDHALGGVVEVAEAVVLDALVLEVLQQTAKRTAVLVATRVIVICSVMEGGAMARRVRNVEDHLCDGLVVLAPG